MAAKRPLVAAALLSGLERAADAWNSFATHSQVYTFQEFYADAQYGPDFGYYSTGRILHEDGLADNGIPEHNTAQEWFNSYTTLPMSLSPFFAHALCDRLVTMWYEMGRPSPIHVVEFGGGTGMLARDVLRRSRDVHPDFFAAVVRYVIGERSSAMRVTQGRTAAEFVASGKLLVVEADGRQAADLRPVLDAATPGHPVRGFILSNEVLDEFDPVRLRLVWRKHDPPSREQCASCGAYREAQVLHSVDAAALAALLEAVPDGRLGSGPTAASVEELAWEGGALMCGLVATRTLGRAMLAVAEDLEPEEKMACAPLLVCCFPFILAVDQALRFHHDALDTHQILHRHGDDSRELVRLYRHHLQRVNGTVPLSKERYRELRRLAASRGHGVERALLVGDPGVLPGRLHSHEIFLALPPARCHELHGWMRRQSARLAAAAALREVSAPLYDGDASTSRTARHLKVVLRPGEAAFVQQAAQLIDEGFMVTFDYGADADALVWQALIRPNHEGIQIIDAREELSEECTAVSYLECPGLQDITTSVDFTEVAVAGKQLGGWEVRAYGPIFLVEVSFDSARVKLAPPRDPFRLGHLVERAGGVQSTGLKAWYQKPEEEPWASFKVLVQHRGLRGANWTLGPASSEWPLQAAPRFFRSPSPCWGRDLTKPPLASLIASSAHEALGDAAWGAYTASAAMPGCDAPHTEMASNSSHLRAFQLLQRQEGEEGDEEPMGALLEQFIAVLMSGEEPLNAVLEEQHAIQQQAYADVHLSLLLVDYLRLLQEEHEGDWYERQNFDYLLDLARELAASRRLPELYGQEAFERVLGDFSSAFALRDGGAAAAPPASAGGGGGGGSGTGAGMGVSGGARPPHVCLAARALHEPRRSRE